MSSWFFSSWLNVGKAVGNRKQNIVKKVKTMKRSSSALKKIYAKSFPCSVYIYVVERERKSHLSWGEDQFPQPY